MKCSLRYMVYRSIKNMIIKNFRLNKTYPKIIKYITFVQYFVNHLFWFDEQFLLHKISFIFIFKDIQICKDYITYIFTLSIFDRNKCVLYLYKSCYSLLIRALVSDWVANFADIMPNMS